MEKALIKYIRIFRSLRIDKAHGNAPHKPILLISVLQLFRNGLNKSNRIFITPELVASFNTNWNLLVTTNHDRRISLPFYHLVSDKIWRLIPKPGFENILKLSASMRSFDNLNAAVDHAIIEDELVSIMIDNKNNEVLQQVLLDQYFVETKSKFSDSNSQQKKVFDEIERIILNSSSSEYRQEISKLISQKNEEEIFLRGSIFKREIPKIYNNTCCISGMRIDSLNSASMIDACHIVPFSVSRDDTITNGISLCPNLHRAFDRGLISIDEDYCVVVSNSFKEDETNYSIRAFEGNKIKLPKIKSYYPLMDNFNWHKNNVFK